jgi:hypothetical protein
VTEEEKTNLSVSLTLISFAGFFMNRFNICGIPSHAVEEAVNDFQDKVYSQTPPSKRRKRGIDNGFKDTDRYD